MKNQPAATASPDEVTILTHGTSPQIAEGVAELDTYDLAALSPVCRLLLVGMHTDQIHLERNRNVLDAFLARGATLVIGGGHVLREIFTGAPRWRRAPSTHQADLDVFRCRHHPVWEGTTMEELSCRRGVRGFYGRGGYPVLDEADIVINRVQQLPVDVELRRGGGRVLMHGGNDLWGFGHRDEPGGGLLPRLLRWGLGDWR